MVEVDELEERLNARALLDLLLAHRLLDLERCPCNPRNDGVTVFPPIGALVKGLDDKPLLTGHAAVEHDDDLARFQAAGKTGQSRHIAREFYEDMQRSGNVCDL